MSSRPPGEYVAGKYDLGEDDLRMLTSKLLHERPPQSEERFICYRLDGDDEFSDIGRSVEREVFEHSFDNDAEEMAAEYGKYEGASTFFVSIDTESKTATGALRVIGSSEEGFKSLNDLEVSHLGLHPQQVFDHYEIENPNTVWDIGTVAVLPEFRSAAGAISVQLYRAMYVTAMKREVEHFVSIIDQKPLQKLTDYLGIPFESLMDSKPFSYLGSDNSQAVYGYVPEFYKKMNRKRRTVRGLLARKALNRLVRGSEDDTLQL
ncbi:MAG: hypothetical protein JWO61_189 [Candidatus Saccharibacteria bacterium]|nr:hypothetical protein [Candidatus Saccharibacteria bacterium]